MTVRLLTVDGRQFELPVTLRWRILRTGGVPCDEIEAVCLYDGKLGAILPLCHRFAAYEGEEAVLRRIRLARPLGSGNMAVRSVEKG